MDIDHSNASGPDPDNPTISSASSSISTTSSAEYDEDAARSCRRRSIAVMVSSITIAAMEVASGLYDEASAGISPISRSPISSSSSRAKRERMTSAIAISSLGRELSDIKDLLRKDLQLTKTNAEAREERKRLKNERLEHKRLECEHLEREPLELKRLECLKREHLEHERLECERLEHEHLECEGWLEHERVERKDLERECLEFERLECERLKLERLECERLELERLEHGHLEQQKGNRQKTDAIYQMQEVDSDLPPEHQAILADLFNKEHNSAKTYLALKSDPVRKAWIKRKLTQAGSG